MAQPETVAAVLAIEQRDLKNVLALKPMAAVAVVFFAVAALQGHSVEGDWSALTRIAREPGFLDRLARTQPGDISQEAKTRAHQMLAKVQPPLTEESVQRQSVVAGVLLRWVKDMLSLSSLAGVAAPAQSATASEKES